MWHVGHDWKAYPHYSEWTYSDALMIELGARAMGCMRAENGGRPSDRSRAIRQRGAAIMRRRLNFDIDPQIRLRSKNRLSRTKVEIPAVPYFMRVK